MLRVQKVRLYPNETMKQILDDLCDYRSRRLLSSVQPELS